jgi:hypothetical protein
LFPVNKSLMAFLLSMFCLLFMQSCLTDQSLEPEGALVSFNGCKTFSAGTYSAEGQDSQDSGQECLEYSYDGNVLRIKHINAVFNCCIETIVGSVSIEGNIITLESDDVLENGQGCYCNCLYDVDFEIRDLVPDIYIILCSTFTNAMEIDLNESGNGLYCEPRNGYPWN